MTAEKKRQMNFVLMISKTDRNTDSNFSLMSTQLVLVLVKIVIDILLTSIDKSGKLTYLLRRGRVLASLLFRGHATHDAL